MSIYFDQELSKIKTIVLTIYLVCFMLSSRMAAIIDIEFTLYSTSFAKCKLVVRKICVLNSKNCNVLTYPVMLFIVNYFSFYYLGMYFSFLNYQHQHLTIHTHISNTCINVFLNRYITTYRHKYQVFIYAPLALNHETGGQ